MLVSDVGKRMGKIKELWDREMMKSKTCGGECEALFKLWCIVCMLFP